MKTRIMHTKIWNDSFFIQLSSQEKLLFIYYLTNPRVNIIHFYECPDLITTAETGVNLSTIEETKKKFNSTKRIIFYKDYVYLKNASKYESYTGSQNDKAKQKLFGELSKDVLDHYNSISDTPINTPLIPSITHNLEGKTSKKEQSSRDMNEDVDPSTIPL